MTAVTHMIPEELRVLRLLRGIEARSHDGDGLGGQNEQDADRDRS